jgi:hypothetical protein
MLGRSVRRASAALVLLTLILWNAWVAHTMVTRLQMSDFRIFYLSARAQLEGRDMYDLPSELQTYAGRTLRSTLVNLNPPHFQLLLLPLALVPAGVALGLWAVVSLLCLGGSLYVIARELDLKPSWPNCWRAAIWLLAFAGMGAVLATGEMSFLLSLPLTLAWAAARRERWSRAGIYLGLAMSLKLFLLIFIPYFVLRRRLAAAAASCAAASACFVAGVLIFGPSSYWSWLSQLASVSWAWRSANASVLGILTRSLSENPHFTPFTGAPELVLPLWLPAVAIVGVLTLVVVTFDRTESAVDRAFALLLSAALLISPLGWIYYLWLGLGPFAALALNWRNGAGRNPQEASAAAARWRQRFLILAVPGLVWPHFATFAFQPHAWATPLLASAYFWSAAALWCAFVLDGWAVNPRTAALPRRAAAASVLAISRTVDQEDRPEERDESPDRHMAGRPAATHDEHPENYDRARDLRDGKCGERASPPEGRAQHSHQLDVAPAHPAAAHDGDQEDHTPAHERTEPGLDHGWIASRQRGQAQRVHQPWQRDDVGDDPDPQIKDHDQREPAEQREKLPPARGHTKPPKGQQCEAESQPRTAREGNRPGNLGEPARYFVDGDPVEGCPGINRGAG